MMLGLAGTEIAVVFWLSLVSSIFCVGYGLSNWNAKEAKAELKRKPE
jgi:hypothetical protein